MSTAAEQDAFDRFLERLDPSRDRAGERYELIRRKVVKFFQWRGCSFPEDHADDVMGRMIGKYAKGEEILEPATYCLGVARLFYLEIRKGQVREQAAVAELKNEPQSGAVFEDESSSDQAYECLNRCLAGLPEENHQLILRYYEFEGGAKIEHRKQLAEGLSIPLNALRIRALRLRDKLEHCVRGCVGRAAG